MPVSADLGNNLEDYVNALVKSGRYHSKSEVLREGVRLLQERETRQNALDALLKEALDDVRTGQTRPAKEVFAELRAELKEIETAKRAG